MRYLILIILCCVQGVFAGDASDPVCGIKSVRQLWYAMEIPASESAKSYFESAELTLPENGLATEISSTSINVISLLGLMRCVGERSDQFKIGARIVRWAKSAWGRGPTREEMQLLSSAYLEATEENEGAYLVCSLIWSSPEVWIR